MINSSDLRLLAPTTLLEAKGIIYYDGGMMMYQRVHVLITVKKENVSQSRMTFQSVTVMHDEMNIFFIRGGWV